MGEMAQNRLTHSHSPLLFTIMLKHRTIYKLAISTKTEAKRQTVTGQPRELQQQQQLFPYKLISTSYCICRERKILGPFSQPQSSTV